MDRALNPRSAALIAMVVLACLALLVTGVSAADEPEDWRILKPEERTDEQIVVAGNLYIDHVGSLHLVNCELRFTGGGPDDLRVLVNTGSLMLEDSIIVSENGGRMDVSGHLEFKGDSRVDHMDVQVRSRGTLAVRDANLVLSGRYTSERDNDPVSVQIGGSAVFVDSSVHLQVAFVSSDGTTSFTRSAMESSYDFGWAYLGDGERLTFGGGTVSIVDSSFSSLDGGIRSRADLSARDTTFDHASLIVHVPEWLDGISTWIDGCAFTDSGLEISLEDSNRKTKDLDILVEDLTVVRGGLLMDLEEAYSGSIVIDTAAISGYTGYGVTVFASGIDGDLVLESLDLEGPYGLQAQADYSGLRLLNSTINSTGTAMDFLGFISSVPAFIDNVEVTAGVGLKATKTVLKVRDSDLSGSTVPVRGEDGAAVTLTDCQLDVDEMVLDVGPGERTATIWVERHLAIDSVRWAIGDPIDSGKVLFYIRAGDTLLPSVKEWVVGDPDLPIVRLMEWSLDGEGLEDRLVFDDIEPHLYMEGNTFDTEEGFVLDPWQVDPSELVFEDNVKPWLLVSGDIQATINDPNWLIHGTVGDVGTGVDGVAWQLYTSTGELVSSGEVDFLSDGRWQTTIHLTGDMQRVQMMPRDRSGNDEAVPLQPVDVVVPTPLLTVYRPEANTKANLELITVSGTADFYASEVHVQVMGHTEVAVVPVISGHFSKIFQLPQEGLNDLVISAHDPYGGFDEKRVAVTLDTIAPALMLDDLETDMVNYLNNPSLVISGSTDDPRATISVLGQEVGLVGKDFVTTVTIVEGSQTIKVLAMDDVGNANVVNLDVVLDTGRPMLTLVNPKVSPFWSTESEMEVVLEVDEELSMAIVNGDPVQVVDGRITHEAWLSSGPYEVNVFVVDLAGNGAERQVVLRLDMEEPSLTFVSPQQGQVVNTTSVPLVVVTSEPGCSLFVLGADEAVEIDTNEQSPGRLLGTLYLGPGEGERSVTILIRDRAGNTVSRSLDLVVDTVIPFINIDGFHDGMKVTTEPLRVRGTTEPGAKVVWVNGKMASLTVDGEFSTTIELEEGWQDVRFMVIDRAGNTLQLTYRVKALGQPSIDPPIEVLAAGTIVLTLGALAVTTEIGRWSVLAFFIPLYTKLRRDKILDQRTRGLIEGYITANPGCNYTIIRDNLSLADGTLTYHLQVLEREGFVYSIREGLFRCFYPQGVPPPRRGKLHLSDVQSDIVRIVKRIPGITVGEIATAMNRRPNVISYHLKLLKEGGLIRMEEDGRHVRVYPIDTAVAMI